jgi:pyrroline-5-carboxylate reductase
MNSKLSILGAGNMGSAILEAVIKNKVIEPADILLVDLDQKKLAKWGKKKVKTSTNPADVAKAKIILLATKPQHIEAACEDWKTNSVIVSILAGTKIDKLKKLTGSKKIVRVMPNTPAQIGAGISGWFATKTVSPTEKTLVKKILKSCGEEVELKQEKLIDAVTAISGSGPAYYFNFTEALADAGKKLGLGKDAEKFATHTFIGAAKLAESSDKDLKTLRENVTSKGGTTEAALKVLKKIGLGLIVAKAAKEALKRGRELSK